MEFKVQPSATKSINGRLVTGITAVMGNIDDGNDRIWPGAFTKTIKERANRFRHLWMHNANDPPTAAIKEIGEVGRDELPQSVLDAAPNATGGLQVTREYLDTPRGNEILAGITAGAINEMSFGYDIIPGKSKVVDENGVKIRELYELRLWDTSDVTWGMNPATTGSKLLPLDFLLTRKAWTDEGGGLGLYLEVLRRVGAGLSTVEAENGQDLDSIEDVLDALGLASTALWRLRDEARGEQPDMWGYMSALTPRERKSLRLVLLGAANGLKAGARHSAADGKMINQLHTLARELGATNCAGETTEETEKATPSRADGQSLTSQPSAAAEEAAQIIREHYERQPRLRALRRSY